MANGEEGVGRTQGLGPACSTYLASRALRSRVDARSHILGAKHGPGIPYNLERVVLC